MGEVRGWCVKKPVAYIIPIMLYPWKGGESRARKQVPEVEMAVLHFYQGLKKGYILRPMVRVPGRGMGGYQVWCVRRPGESVPLVLAVPW